MFRPTHELLRQNLHRARTGDALSECALEKCSSDVRNSIFGHMSFTFDK